MLIIILSILFILIFVVKLFDNKTYREYKKAKSENKKLYMQQKIKRLKQENEYLKSQQGK